MFSQVITCGLVGLDGYKILVETDISNGLPAFDIVGLADTAVKEARERVRAAMTNSGFVYPNKRIIVNLAPADTKKEGAGFDLPIAIGMLLSLEVLFLNEPSSIAFFGELALDGQLRPVTGTLSKAIAARDLGLKSLFLPIENANEAAWVKDIEVFPAKSLLEIVKHFTGESKIEPMLQNKWIVNRFYNNYTDHNNQMNKQTNNPNYEQNSTPNNPHSIAISNSAFQEELCNGEEINSNNAHSVLGIVVKDKNLGRKESSLKDEEFFEKENSIVSNREDFSDVKGQRAVKRAIEVAAAGGHHLFMLGGPGSGKTMLAKRIPGILPLPTLEESIEITRIQSVAGLLTAEEGMVFTRPFRCPHHTISNTGLIGGGRIPKPGEISLAHGGVLFLDELPEFNRAALDSLRQPLEDGRVVLARIHSTISYPSRFVLVAAANPCKCGNYGDSTKVCTCPPGDAERYLSKISGPLLDRMDIQVHVPSITYQEMSNTTVSESSEFIRIRVARARERQLKRFSRQGLYCNAQLSGNEMKQICQLDFECIRLMEKAFQQLSFSMRAYDRILRVARTIADLDDSDSIRLLHLAEAIQYRTTISERR